MIGTLNSVRNPTKALTMSSIRQRAAHTGMGSPSSAGRDPATRRERTRLPGDDYRTGWQHMSHQIMTPPPPVDDLPGNSSDDGLSSRRSSESSYPLHQHYQNDAADIAHKGKIRTGRHLRAERTRLEDYHVAYRIPLHVPDNAYRAYLQGQTGKTRKRASMFSKNCCAHTCISFSVVAILFLCFIGFLIDTQPILMAGTLQSYDIPANDGTSKVVTKYLLPRPGEVLPAARNAFRAAYAYFFCILLSLCALHPMWIQSQIYRLRHQYQDIPDHLSSADSTLPNIHTPNQHNNNNAHHDAAPPSWTGAIINRCSYVIRQRLAEVGWYHPRRGRRSVRRDE